VTVRATQVIAPGTIELISIPDASAAGPGDVSLELIACGICGSNLHHLHHPELIGADRRDKPGALGHEVAARVVAVGEGVTTHAVGDLVALEPQLAAACGDCEGCATGMTWFCREPRVLPVWGLADRFVVRAQGAWLLPPTMDPLVATLMEPMGCSVHAIRATALCAEREDDLAGIRVAVLGAGATGLLAVAAARHFGAAEIVCVARHEHQAALATRMGADRVLRDDDGELVATLTSFAPELVIECVGGRAETIDLAVKVAAVRGEISVLGLFDAPQVIDARSAFKRELRMIFPVVYGEVRGRHDFEFAAQLLSSGSLPFGDLITHRFELADVQQAYTVAGTKSAGVVRVVVGRTSSDIAR
jgi:threonine dehydrogenase-like Zn-dependent dehydrogenase